MSKKKTSKLDRYIWRDGDIIVTKPTPKPITPNTGRR